MKKQGIEHPVIYPKGELKVICAQENGVYLVERFREVHKVRKRITEQNPAMKGLLGWASQFEPETKEIVEDVLGDWSAELNEKQSLKVEFSTTVSVGDSVGRGL